MVHKLFSIITPVYNVEKYLPRFLDSIIAQTFKSFEIILVDDGSSDFSGKICDEYAVRDCRFNVIHKPNGGVSSARNCGIEQSRGEWLLFFDSDDVVHSNALQQIYEAMISAPNTDIIIFSIEEVFNNGSKIKHDLPVAAPLYYDTNKLISDIFPFFCRGSSFLNSPCNKTFRKGIIDKYCIRYQKRVRGEDWLFCLGYFRHIKSAYIIPDVLYSYMRNDGSAMSKYCPEQFLLWSENWNCKKALIRDYNLVVDENEMCREMLIKLYLFVNEVKKNESAQIRNRKLHDMLCSNIFCEWLKASPSSFRELFVKYRLLIDRFFYSKL